MQPTNKPQCQAAREFILAMHAKRAGTITEEEYEKAGQKLNGAIQIWGKP